MGGGYRAAGNPNDPSYVGDPGSASWSDKSKGIFMVSLDTGELVASVTFDAMDASDDGPGNMRYALPSTPAVLDHDFDGFADVVYIGDLGGRRLPRRVKTIPADKPGEFTEFIYEELKFDVKHPERMFTLQALRR